MRAHAKHCDAYGIARRRRRQIGWPQFTQEPYVPAWMRARAAWTPWGLRDSVPNPPNAAQLAGHKLDRDCVAALAANRAEVEQIQGRFREDAIG
jgi:hypothetical protein